MERETVADILYCIIVMVLGAVRFNWSLHDFYFLLKNKVHSRKLTDEEWDLINSQGTISEKCIKNLDWGTSVIKALLTAAMVALVKVNPRVAKHCIEVPNITMAPEGMPDQTKVGLERI